MSLVGARPNKTTPMIMNMVFFPPFFLIHPQEELAKIIFMSKRKVENF
jgi:hypothetical protein